VSRAPIATATEAQLSAIRARATNDDARGMASHGVALTYDQVAELDGAINLGDSPRRVASSGALAWLAERLGLRCRETDVGVECTPS